MLKNLARDWRIKVTCQNLLGILPARVGFRLNEQLTTLTQGGVHERFDFASRVRLGCRTIRLVNEKTAFDPQGKTVLEWGTGWHGIDLVLFHLLGVRKVITVDHYPHLTLPSLIQTIRSGDRLGVVELLGEFAPSQRTAPLWEALVECSRRWDSLDTALSHLRVDYRIAKSCSPLQMGLKPGTIDLFYSQSILQRIPEKDLRAGVQYVGRSLTNERSVYCHCTDQHDFHVNGDPNLWRLAYLKYGEFFYSTFLSGRLNSQNRLREPDFLDLLESAGMPAIYLESVFRRSDLDRLSSIRLAKRFRSMPLENIVIAHSRFVGVCSPSRSRRLERKLVPQ